MQYKITSSVEANWDESRDSDHRDPQQAIYEATTDWYNTAMIIAEAFANDLTDYESNVMGQAQIWENFGTENAKIVFDVQGDWK